MIKRLRPREGVEETLVRAIPVEVLLPVNAKKPNPQNYDRTFVYLGCRDWVSVMTGYIDHHVEDWTASKTESFHLSCYVTVFCER